MTRDAYLVTGASAGIGEAYAERLARRGHDLVLVARSGDKLGALSDRLRAGTGAAVDTLVADLGAPDGLALVEARLREDAAITGLVNNAGVAGEGPILGADPAYLSAMIAINVTAVARLAAAIAPRLAKRGGGAIINIASVTALMPEAFSSVYPATKAFTLAFSEAIGKELTASGVRVQAVLPGVTRTAIWSEASLAGIPAGMVMEVGPMVDAALAGFDLGERITIPSLPDAGDLDAFLAARARLAPNLSLSEPAGRYARQPGGSIRLALKERRGGERTQTSLRDFAARAPGPDRASKTPAGWTTANDSTIREFMNSDRHVAALAALAHPDRLAVFRLLARRAPDGVRPTEIAAVLGLKPNTLSGHVHALTDAGLARTWRDGKSVFYSIDLGAVGGLVEYLVADCCRGRPDVCAPAAARLASTPTPGGADMANRTYNALFICTGNSARSIFAEAILAKEGGGRFNAFSAGTRPSTGLNPFAVEILERMGHDVSGLRAKHIAAFQGEDAPRLDFVFTVCDQAANEECPPWPGQTLTAHWGLPDPVKAEGAETERALAFRQAYGALERRIRAFVALPLASLDRISLQTRLDAIGREADAPADEATG